MKSLLTTTTTTLWLLECRKHTIHVLLFTQPWHFIIRPHHEYDWRQIVLLANFQRIHGNVHVHQCCDTTTQQLLQVIHVVRQHSVQLVMGLLIDIQLCSELIHKLLFGGFDSVLWKLVFVLLVDVCLSLLDQLILQYRTCAATAKSFHMLALDSFLASALMVL